MTDRALTRVQAAERYGISERHLRHLEGEHQIPVLRLGRADLKGDAVEDLRKARWYLDREIAKREAAR